MRAISIQNLNEVRDKYEKQGANVSNARSKPKPDINITMWQFGLCRILPSVLYKKLAVPVLDAGL